MIEFYLNGQRQTLEQADPNLSILEWLRTKKRLTGTKEGCASGDCGACTVLIGSAEAQGGWRYDSANSCITPLASLQGKHLISIEAMQTEPAHPVQTAMVECHGSQCGFCTPGIVMSLVSLHQARVGQSRDADLRQIHQALSGNLCRCTGYRPIVDAARQALTQPPEHWSGASLFASPVTGQSAAGDEAQLSDDQGRSYALPTSLTALRALLTAEPQARLIAGGTDLMLEVTQQLNEIDQLVSTERVPELRRIECVDGYLQLGAAVTYRELEAPLVQRWPAFGTLLERLGSVQIRNRGTLGGNIGNASPIADMPPALIALGASLKLDSSAGQRQLALEAFFLDYKRTALQPGEFIRSVRIPEPQAAERLFIYKVSKRLDDDISAVLGAFWFRFAADGRQVLDCRLAWGGMAAIPKRAPGAEAALRGAELDQAAIERAITALAADLNPIADVRASAGYRCQLAANLLRRALLEYQQGSTAELPLQVTDYA